MGMRTRERQPSRPWMNSSVCSRWAVPRPERIASASVSCRESRGRPPSGARPIPRHGERHETDDFVISLTSFVPALIHGPDAHAGTKVQVDCHWERVSKRHARDFKDASGGHLVIRRRASALTFVTDPPACRGGKFDKGRRSPSMS